MDGSVGLLDSLHWLGHASFRLDGPPVIYFDPWRLREGLPLADIILVSHEHSDHCSPEDVERISGPETVVVASPSAARKLHSQPRVLRPGMFVRIRLPMGEPHPAMLLPESAISTDQGAKFVLVVNDKGIVEFRPVTLGSREPGGWQVVEPVKIMRDQQGIRRERPGEYSQAPHREHGLHVHRLRVLRRLPAGDTHRVLHAGL